MDRRNFFKKSGSLCLAFGVSAVVGTLSTSCSLQAIYKTSLADNKISVPSSLFAQTDLMIIQAKQLEYNLAVRKLGEDRYEAILLRCTHADNQLNSTGTGFVCNMHGSKFRKDGAVEKGPAMQALKKYPAKRVADQIIIYVNPI